MRLTIVVSQGDGMKEEHYFAHFTHTRKSTPSKSKWDKDYDPFEPIGATICSVHAGPCATKERPCKTEGTLTGITWCSHMDNFNRATGRKIAFTRAVATLPRDIRAGLWKAYLEYKPPTK